MNFGLIFLATIVQFVIGALWYSPLMFGKTWMSIMEVSHYTKEELQKMQKSMMPFYGLQFVLTLITTWVLASNLAFSNITGMAAYFYAFFMWFGYMMPISVSAVIWSSTKRKFWIKQISIMLGMQLVGIMIATFIITF
jgi:hypothetical protein